MNKITERTDAVDQAGILATSGFTVPSRPSN
jgi:hypothetical protein